MTNRETSDFSCDAIGLRTSANLHAAGPIGLKCPADPVGWGRFALNLLIF
jgi:hypothetical protein